MIKIIMGSKSDYSVMQEAENLLKQFDLEYSIEVVSAHRTPDKMFEFSKNLRQEDIVIAGAGGSAHLPGMVAALCSNVVIGVPIKSKALNGLDSLYSIVQMPKGISVACVAIDNAHNAALLAIQIKAINDNNILEKLKTYRSCQTKQVLEVKL